MKHSYSVSLNFSISQPKCYWILVEITCWFLRQHVASAPAVFKLQVSFRIIHKGEGLQTIHKAAALGHASSRLWLRLRLRLRLRLWLSLFPELLISPAIINGDTLHKARQNLPGRMCKRVALTCFSAFLSGSLLDSFTLLHLKSGKGCNAPQLAIN